MSQVTSELEFSDILWRLKSRLFENSFFSKVRVHNRAQTGNNFSVVDSEDYFVKTIKKNKIRPNGSTSVFYFELSLDIFGSLALNTFSTAFISQCFRIRAQPTVFSFSGNVRTAHKRPKFFLLITLRSS
jgi:hypothetical protein